VIDPATGTPKQCVPGTDPASPAAQAGLRTGDIVTGVNGQPVTSWDQMSGIVRQSGGKTISVTYERDGVPSTASVSLPLAQRVKADVDPSTPIPEIGPDDLERVGILGISQEIPKSTAGPVAAIGMTWDQTVVMVKGTFESLKKFPEKIPKLWDAIVGAERDPETPISVVGASRIGGELFERGEWPMFLNLLALLNFFVGIFNLLPLLPLDGGHIAIAWFERVRSWIYARLGRADPGRVDYFKLMPITYAVILIFGAFTVLTVTADIVNPITLF